MPKVGLSRPYIAKYSTDGAGKVSYTDGMRLGRAVKYSLSASSSSSSDFYADNELAETAGGTFSSGELTVETAELEQGASAVILGSKIETMEIDGEQVPVQVFDDRMKAPYLGYGNIIKSVVKGTTKWRGVVLTKIQFNIPEDAADTQGESITWLTDSVTAKVMRDDTVNHRWKMDAVFDSEAKADSFIRHVLKITDTTLESITVKSEEGNESGKTKITVTPELTDGRSYRYKCGSDFNVPELYEDLSTWSAWNGTDEIEAATGDVIIIAEVDSTGLAMAAGVAAVTAKGAE